VYFNNYHGSLLKKPQQNATLCILQKGKQLSEVLIFCVIPPNLPNK